MISVVAKIPVKEGANADFEAVAKKLCAAVAENEPDCVLYEIHKTEDPQMYLFVERYKDMAAIENHRKSDHFRSLGREMGAHMDGPADVIRGEQI